MQAEVRRFLARNLFRIEGEVEFATNTLSLRTVMLRRVRVSLLDGMCDLAKPVTVTCNGKTWRGAIQPSAKCMLEHYVRTRDGQRLVVNQLEINIGGQTKVVYP